MAADIISMTPVRSKAIAAPKLEWGKALTALRRLLADKEDTTAVFEIMRALNGDSIKKGYDRLLTVHDGGRMAYEAAELAPKLMNDAWLDSFAPGTVGAAYRDFIRSQHLSAEGLAEVSRSVGDDIEVKHPYAWFGRRNRDVHDLWHILSGYHRDALGEACLVAFSYAQTKGLGWALIAVGAAFSSRKGDYPYSKAIWQGYQRGKAAAWLLGEDYERLMAEPLEDARRRLNITPATLYNAIPPEARDTVLPETKLAA
jgi:ubiquinone biosynthesis protein COQ4